MVSVIIPVYKNTELFLANLKHNLPYLKGCQIIVVNDDPYSSLRNDLIGYPNIQLIENKINLGFGQSINRGVALAEEDLIMLLNSDVILDDQSYLKSVNKFNNNPDLFGVSFSQQEKDGSLVGRNKIYWKKGFFQHKRNPISEDSINGWAEGGSCLLDRQKFLHIGGFDKDYAPFYWEDIDLSYRAWKNNYQIIFCPETRVKHQHESTIGKYFPKQTIEEIAFRNQLLFIWKNINDKKLLRDHLLRLFPQIVSSKIFFIGFLKALYYLPRIIFIRSKNKPSLVTDSAVLKQFHE